MLLICVFHEISTNGTSEYAMPWPFNKNTNC